MEADAEPETDISLASLHAYHEGKTAQVEGYRLRDNPYASGVVQDSWVAGYEGRPWEDPTSTRPVVILSSAKAPPPFDYGRLYPDDFMTHAPLEGPHSE